MSTCARCLLLHVALTAGLSAAACGQQVAYFRHDHGLAADDARALPDALDPAAALWRRPLPMGNSTPLVVGARIVLTAAEENRLLTICLDRATGEELWRQSIAAAALETIHAEGSHADATVASDGRRLFAFFGSYGLLCYDLDGKLLWSQPLGPFRDEFGSASSPVLVDDLVILNEDHDLDSFLIAFRQDTGEVAWRTPREGFTRSYATPVVWNAGGERQLVIAGSLQLAGYDLASGRQLWTLDGFARIVNTTPVVSGDRLYVATWSPGGDSDARIAMEPWAVALSMWDKNADKQLQADELPAGEVRTRFFRIDLDGNHALDEAEWNKYARIFELAQNTLVALEPDSDGKAPRTVWEYKRGLPYVASPLVYREHLVMIKDGGVVTVLRADDGKLLQQVRARDAARYYASPVGGDGKVYVGSVEGVVTVFGAGPRLEVLSTHAFGERLAATPLIFDGRVYLRTAKALYCFGNR